jgi:tryptophan 2,3-dioxygenase
MDAMPPAAATPSPEPEAHAAPLTYARYLQVEALLALQSPRSGGPGTPPEHDETLFIIVHQVYELWFKQMLHETDYLQGLLYSGDITRALHTLRRLLTILKTVVAQVDVLETMTPLAFNSFRGFLESASGFQSAQFRALEFALGHKRLALVRHFPEGTPARARLEARFAAPTLWDAFLHALAAAGLAVPPEELGRDVTQPLAPSPTLQALLLDLYRQGDPLLVRLCERLVDLDEGIQEWRYRHIKMVERTIGSKAGTGGSAGSAYLRSTLAPLFPDLWTIRALL